jgi:glycine cleavage system regulatory protein
MENLNEQEIIELIKFYKQKASDNEFTLLQTQLKFSKSAALIQELTDLVKAHEITINNLLDIKTSSEQQIAELLNPKPPTKKVKP